MDLTKTKKISTVWTFSQSAEIVKATRQWKSITIHEIDAICSGLSSTWISVLSGARVAVAVEHGITGESSLKNWKKFSPDQATLKKFDYSKMVSDIDQLFSSHENLVQSRPIQMRIYHSNERCRISAILRHRGKLF